MYFLDFCGFNLEEGLSREFMQRCMAKGAARGWGTGGLISASRVAGPGRRRSRRGTGALR